MELKLLQATFGDAIHLRFKDRERSFRNILIDGGTQDTYIFKNSKGKMEYGALKLLVEQIRERDEYIDLLILTHVDDDHIGGVLKWFQQDTEAKNLVKKVWFNSGKLISEYFEKAESTENLLEFWNEDSLNTSIKQGATFEAYIEEHAIWDRRLLKSNDEIRLFGLTFTMLSPPCDKLKAFLSKWEKESPLLDTSGKTDYAKNLSDLIKNDTFKSDASISNGSSLAFMVTYEGKNLLFLGDAYAQPVIDSLKKMGYSSKKPLVVEYVKISHHGSKGNTSSTLLNMIQSENYLISTDSSVHGLPDKLCLARIIKNRKKVNLHFNYPALADEIFNEQDYIDFPNFTVCDAQNAIKI